MSYDHHCYSDLEEEEEEEEEEKQLKIRNLKQPLSRQLLGRNQAVRAHLRFVTAENIVELFRKQLPCTSRNVAVNLEFRLTVMLYEDSTEV